MIVPQIYLISPPKIEDINIFVKQLEEIFSLHEKPGMFQLRLKDCSENQIEEAIVKIKPLCNDYAVPFILNDNISLALKYGIGVHVGGKDASLEDVLSFKQQSRNIIGVSCYNLLDRAKTFAGHVTCVSFGAMFLSKTKESAKLCHKETVVEFAKTHKTPISIIGGITTQNLHEICDILPFTSFVCVISSVWQ